MRTVSGPGAKKKMICVRQHDLGAEVIGEVAREDSLDGGLGADGHEDGGFDGPVVSVEEACARAGFGAGGLKLKSKHSDHCRGVV